MSCSVSLSHFCSFVRSFVCLFVCLISELASLPKTRAHQFHHADWLVGYCGLLISVSQGAVFSRGRLISKPRSSCMGHALYKLSHILSLSQGFETGVTCNGSPRHRRIQRSLRDECQASIRIPEAEPIWAMTRPGRFCIDGCVL